MPKSETKKIILETTKKHLGEKKYHEEVTFHDSLTENANRNHTRFPLRGVREKSPICISLFEGLPKLRQYLQATEAPSRAGVNFNDFMQGQTAINRNLLMDDEDEDESPYSNEYGAASPIGMQPPPPSTAPPPPKERRHLRAEAADLSNQGRSTWHTLLHTFVGAICHELERLSPPSLSSGIDKSFRKVGSPMLENYAEFHPHQKGPCMAPVVVLGFDKGAEQNKAATQLKRKEQTDNTLKKKRDEDIALGYLPERGMPVTWASLGDLLMDPVNTALPYPPEKLFASRDMRFTSIRYICRSLIERARSGTIARCILRNAGNRRMHRVVQIVLEGHRMFPEDDLVDLTPTYEHGDIGEPSIPAAYKEGNKVPQYMGDDSPLKYTPISIFLVFDENDVIAKRIQYIYECPSCELLTANMKYATEAGQSVGAGTMEAIESVYELFNIARVELGGRYFCSTNCRRYNTLSRRVVVHGQDKHRGIASYCFVGKTIPPRVYELLKVAYMDTPVDVNQYSRNDIGEFDFTMYHCLYETAHQVAKRYLDYNFDRPFDAHNGPRGRIGPAIGARVVTVDTDAMVIGLLATEVLRRQLKTDINIFMVDTHHLTGINLENEKAGLPRYRKPLLGPNGAGNNSGASNFPDPRSKPSAVYSLSCIADVFAAIFQGSSYPASNAAFILYLKENDYVDMFLKGISIQIFFDVYKSKYLSCGANLIIDAEHTKPWRNQVYRSKLNNPMLMLDADVFQNFVRSLTSYARDVVDYKGDSKKRSNFTYPAQKNIDKRLLKHIYVLCRYCDSTTGRMLNKWTIHPDDQPLFGFTDDNE